ncbi:hypothetical protein T4E_10029 [Trichinella pseudospiralis]|uniref:Uncharacterized protein n=1 Tax=Trichinella pseudospiralis TaxID=6337 RepID=A0A0V0YKR4_TRIPS|nr:hypothetical protein T4E_10029 [Trichinella pseudospiralis]
MVADVPAFSRFSQQQTEEQETRASATTDVGLRSQYNYLRRGFEETAPLPADCIRAVVLIPYQRTPPPLIKVVQLIMPPLQKK